MKNANAQLAGLRHEMLRARDSSSLEIERCVT